MAEALDLIWGGENIAVEINKTPRATFHLLEQGLIPARKIGRQWVASRQKLRRHFGIDDEIVPDAVETPA